MLTSQSECLCDLCGFKANGSPVFLVYRTENVGQGQARVITARCPDGAGWGGNKAARLMRTVLCSDLYVNCSINIPAISQTSTQKDTLSACV